MRQVLSVLSMLLAALCAASALAGHQVDALLREEEPVRQIAGELPEQEAFSQIVSESLLAQLRSELPGGIADLIGGGAESAVQDLVAPLLESERTAQAWDETLQTTRTDYAAQLEQMFEQGTTGDPSDLDIAVDLSPMTEAMTEPLREGLDSALGWLPFLDSSSFEFLAPEVAVDIEAATQDGADPYTWATLAAVSEHWIVLAVVAAVLLVLGLGLGPGRSRWVALTLGGLLAAGLGLWIALTAASPELGPLPDPAVQSIAEHLQGRFTAWAQPAWWVFSGAAGAIVIVGLLGSVTARSARR